MEIIIHFFDTILIYYPNLFFFAVFLFGFLFMILIIQGIHSILKVTLQTKKKRYKTNYIYRTSDNVIDLIRKVEVKIERVIEKIKKEILLDEKN